MVTLTEAAYRDKVLGGWLGKLAGMAVGSGLDGRKQPNEIGPAHLDSIPAGRPHMAASLDFELVWLRVLERTGPGVGSSDLAAAWLRQISYSESEYGFAAHNLRRELQPPVSGVCDNPFHHSVGALARADVWGLVCPGEPRRAAQYAYEDATLDHGGPAVEAACITAALVSAAFAESDPVRLIETAVVSAPAESRTARAVRDALRWHTELAQWSRTREMLLRAYGAEDVRDAVVAMSFVALALLHDRGDLGRALLTAARCGWSTEATCGAVGAVLGVALGASGIPARVREIAAGEVQAGPGVVGLPASVAVSELGEQTAGLGGSVVGSELRGRVQLAAVSPGEPSVLSPSDASVLIRRMVVGSYVATARRGPLEVSIDYDARCTIGYDVPRRLTIGIANTGAKSLDLGVSFSGPAGFIITTNVERVSVPEAAAVSFTATFTAPEKEATIAATNPFALMVSLDDLEEVSVPIPLIGESLWYAAGPYGDFDQQHAPEWGGVLSGGTALGGEGWRRLSVSEPAVNILTGLEGDAGTYYLATDYLAPRPQTAGMRVGCNDGVKAWVGGQEVLSHHEHRPVSPLSADECAVELVQGWNRLVIKMAQCASRRFLSVILKGADQHLLADVTNTAART